MRLFGNINRLWLRLTGTTAEFSLEVRIFHSLCLISILALAYNVPFNYLIGLPFISLLSLVTLLIFSVLYYLSRYRGKVKTTVTIFTIIGNLLFAINFKYNAGTYGPTDLLMGLCILLVLCVVPKRQQKFWIGLNMAIIISMHLVEYYYPNWVPNNYINRESRYWDLTSAYVVVVIVVYYTITYLRRNYDHEKRSASDKADAIEVQNHHITQQNHELERINSEKNKLMSIIAHDLRSPLSNIQNYLELVTEYELDTAERRMVEGDLLKVTRRTIDMLGKLLIWSKAQMDGVNVKLGYVNLRDALFNTIELEKAIALKKNISLTDKIDWDIRIVADSDMLQLVIRNLISNAIKFTQPGGQISFKAKQISGECWLIIRDNGIGMSAEKQAELFSLQAQSTFGTDNEKGVGLGLLLCKEFTEMQGGRIWVESTPDEGTAFFVSMPAGS
ncbi:HAMP domain-containing histidine kinase [Mucilaginibacter terrigena]|uniref:histidine kinase n=1 Tax=Mucilaginibacter terrigena TaxID=2492395 RepID=A0A4Q5LNX2_9SPHI|nr:HAMP domain-containing sensor histidine kinase [Mucilaginibacter terrigena]RYU91075.1 HAMP domain-containing histidine kinase [Mucilaginibacter terrigena]